MPPVAAAAPFAHMLPAGVIEASYTQWEFYFARHYKRRLLLYVATDEWSADKTPCLRSAANPPTAHAAQGPSHRAESATRRWFISLGAGAEQDDMPSAAPDMQCVQSRTDLVALSRPGNGRPELKTGQSLSKQ
jgi:hypothetical protein